MRGPDTHMCLCCEADVIPVARPLCGTCFQVVPLKLRGELYETWRARPTDWLRLDAVLFKLSQWSAERKNGGMGDRAQ